jgi:DNA polymerase I
LNSLKLVLENPKIEKYAQNFKYDAHIMSNYGVQVRGLSCDSMLASYLLDPATSHKLDSLALRYLNHRMISYEEVTGKKSGGDFAQVDLQAACAYSSEDADVTLQLSELFLKQIREEGFQKLFEEIEIPLTFVLLKMERQGIKVDRKFLLQLQEEFGDRIAKQVEKIGNLAGEPFNIQSPKQLGTILFDKLKLPVQKKTKTGYSTDVDVLTELAKVHELPKEILEFRSLAKLKSTYVDALLILADSKTDRIHTSFNQTIAETGRLSSSDPNLQNIPIRSEDGAKIRQAFIAEQGFTLMSADYSQIELRILAHLSKDKLLIKAFLENLDIHRLTAASIFQVAEEMVTPNMRAAGKTVNFAVVYGQTPFGLSQQLNVTQQQAKNYIDQYFMKYEGVRKYRDAILEAAREKKEVRTLMGRRRFVPDIVSKNTMAKNFAERIAFNTVIQGTAADLIKKAMVAIDRKIEQQNLKSRMLLQVHDELVFEVPATESASMKRLIREEMEGVIPCEVPLRVEIGEGPNWSEAH